MLLNLQSPRESINKAYLKTRPNRSQIELFKKNILNLLDNINNHEGEEHNKNIVSEFLKNTWYSPTHYINTKGRADLVIHTGKDSASPVGVLFEVKKPENRHEMPSKNNLNSKAFQELILYYLRERIRDGNIKIKHLIITNIYEWFIFESSDFERLFANNKKLVEDFTEFEEKRGLDTVTDFFYRGIAEPFVKNLDSQITFTHFDIRDFEKVIRNTDRQDDKNLIVLYKIFSPEHLLKLPFTNDSNTLDKSFYTELLHIIGLEESKVGSKKIIGRKPEERRNPGSLLENTLNILRSEDCLSQLKKRSDFGAGSEEQYYNVTLELVITWINRILFLKLLEGQLIRYNGGDKSFSFLNSARIEDFDELNKLFFRVLAVKEDDRSDDIRKKYSGVPFLNSSLFEPTNIEHNTIRINSLDDNVTLPLLSCTVLKDRSGKRISGSMKPLEYLFAFLDSYDFSSEGSEDIQEENKTLINASVLGLIFEKINGYKDGSFFTPGFITMYMCHETITRAVVQKFNEAKEWNCETITDIYNKNPEISEANRLVNSLKICDPAVGSGHFLVSALNEIIAIKSELGILADRNGKLLRDYTIEVINDELVITDSEGRFFEYNPKNKESQRVQETLFSEKQTIIENCLFGVDINPNSVKICRLRLWIELLKNSYYKTENQSPQPLAPCSPHLETLPNIDINIKCGNSLISRYPLDADIRTALRSSKWTIDNYREAVMMYRNAKSKEEKRSMEELITKIKTDFESEVAHNDKRFLKLNKLKGELMSLSGQTTMFELSKKDKEEWNKKLSRLTSDIKKSEDELSEIKNNKIFENAFEWRFEFPEVLNNDGDFVGFDAMIGNPPYVQLQKEGGLLAATTQSAGFFTYDRMGDIYSLFYERGWQVLKPKGLLCYITSNKWMRAGYGENTRKFFAEKTNPILLIDFAGNGIFDSATVDTNILIFSKEENKETTLSCIVKENVLNNLNVYVRQVGTKCKFNKSESWVILTDIEKRIKEKIEKIGIPLKDWDIQINYGIKTGFNDAFIIDGAKRKELIEQDPKSDEIIRPILRGRDIKRYGYVFADLWLISTFPSLNIDIEHYPAVKQHLLSFGYDRLSQTGVTGARKKTNNKWFETQDSIGYWEDFFKQKIIWGEISDKTKFCIDEKGDFITEATTFLLTGESLFYLLGFLNSRLSEYIFSQIGTTTGVGTVRWKKFTIEQLRIPKISEKKQKKYNNIVKGIIERQLKGEYYKDMLRMIDEMIYEEFMLSQEEKDFIESQ